MANPTVGTRLPLPYPNASQIPDVAADMLLLAQATASVFDTKLMQNDYKWPNAAARIAQTGMTTGDVGDQADNGTQYRYNGTVWLSTSTGLTPIIPTAVSTTSGTAAIDSAGVVRFTNSTSVAIDGLFSSQFENYKIEIDFTAGSAASWAMGLRDGSGNIVTAGSYNTRYVIGAASAATSGIGNGTIWGSMASIAGVRHSCEGTMRGPFLPDVTGWMFETGSANPGTDYGMIKAYAVQTNVTAMTGLYVTMGTGTGKIRAYGFN